MHPYSHRIGVFMRNKMFFAPTTPQLPGFAKLQLLTYTPVSDTEADCFTQALLGYE